ncbi:MAG: DNA polymerase III subunit alpha [Candidatus Omnitrophica bacterium]|nr:DNA polymerase III subunit alpha [Candidatus Omnitrophota bacterium]
MPHADFVHLHCHTQYSLLDAASKIPDLMTQAAEFRFPALAMTDHGNLFGAIEFYEEALRHGIKPILGMEAYIAPGSRFDKQGHGIKEASFHITLLAKDEAGYKNLMKLTTIGYLEGFYYRPRIDKEMLKIHSEGLLALSGCMKGEVPYYTWNEQPEEARRAAREFVDIFGKENFFLEVTDQGLEPQRKVIQGTAALARELGLRRVATNDVHYLYQKSAAAHDALICIGTGSALDEANRMRYHGDQYYLKSSEEMKRLFQEIPDSLQATLEIAERCNLELDFKKTHLPNFEPPEGKTRENYLQELCFTFLRGRLAGEAPPDYRERLNYELSIIHKMGFTSYFLIVWDFIRYAKEKGIPVGPGRGSAAGSLVAYSLGITDIDPITHGLIFERFLNPERISLPDIDIDFCYERRDEVIDYVKRKYGAENVAQIITFGTMAARAVVRDVGRVMGFTYPEVDRLAKLIPMELNITIEQALEREPRLKEAATSEPRVGQLMETSKALEGLVRHASTHAAGVVISDVPLTEYTPLFKTDDQTTTQYSMTALEKIGLLKMDFLGLKTLTVIDDTVKIVKRTQGKEIKIQEIPFDDRPTYEMLGRGYAMGVFQLESSGMRDLLKKMKPSQFGDLVALLALYRPGPLGSGMVDDFIRRMHNPALIQYDHPKLEPVLRETYGIILYQEQVMRIVSDLAGFSLAKADSLRRAMGKKIPEIMEREKKAFMEGCARKGISGRIAERIWNLIEYFSGYGFNKSHSTAYAFISYQTAYLKANFAHEFMTALLTSEMGNTDKVVRYIEACKKMGLEVLPPSVNESYSEFSCATENRIRFGLTAVKNVGTTAIESILKARKQGGPFRSFIDFTQRIDSRVVNRKVLESLIKCGAFDEFGCRRSQLMAQIDRALEVGSTLQRDRQRGQLSFFGQTENASQFEGPTPLPDIPEWPESQLLAFEREMLGFYVTTHPLTKYAKTLKNYATASTDTLSEFRDQEEVTLGGVVDALKEIVTKKGDRMAFLTLQDLSGSCEIIVFPELYRSSPLLMKKDATIFIRGKINSRDDIPKVIAEEVVDLDDVQKRFTRLVSIDLHTAGLDSEVLKKLKEILSSHKGKVPVYLSFRDPSGKTAVIQPGDAYRVETSEALFQAIEGLVGENAVKIR